MFRLGWLMCAMTGCVPVSTGVDAPTAPVRSAPLPASTYESLEIRCPDSDPVGIQVELADDDFSRERGLMYRRYLPRNHGMLFVFEDMGHRSFWMQNTFVSLDVVFADGQKQIVGWVEGTRPLSDDSVEVESDSQYVLEVSAGFLARHPISADCSLHF